MDDTYHGERPAQYTADLIDDVYSNYDEEESDPSDGFESDASTQTGIGFLFRAYKRIV
jgi:hypothetical protein